ncbi:hypothetical protein SAMN06265795_102660 [Noviherbaspirillum humi]|uniref:Muramidase (Phage lambda lysozyme) n=1 Tax=Noviherbaspirillum humi TaxID=1688639 RepID=A0A239EG46_9BURK|nr:hypothetical protein [Noviherbaspirillum humi]SNS42872.1 hypothetical protein SAMN06265795_102660 [Noviherbaspirillum humi]
MADVSEQEVQGNPGLSSLPDGEPFGGEGYRKDEPAVEKITKEEGISAATAFPDNAEQGEAFSSTAEGQENPSEPADTATLSMSIIDFAMQPIPGLKYRLKTPTTTIAGVTKDDGRLELLVDLDPSTEVELYVYREHACDYKYVGTLLAEAGWNGYSIVSPKVKAEVETELHHGEPGNAEQQLPKPSADEKKAAPAPSGTSASSAPQGTKNLEKNATGKGSSNDKATNPSSKPTTAPNQTAVKVVNDRDSRGHPQATVQDSTLDWLKRKVLAAFNLWTWKDFHINPSTPKAKPAARPATPQPQKKNATPSSPAPVPLPVPQAHPKLQPSIEKPVAVNTQDAVEQVKRLVEFAENQLSLDYTPYKRAGAPTINVLAKYAQEKDPKFDPKAPTSPKGICLVYVKVALHRSGYTSGHGNSRHAKESGADWISYGFTDISQQLPKIEIRYEDVSKSISVGVMKADSDTAVPEKYFATYTQPDLMYTAPGDIIVYEQVHPYDPTASGHIDIRTYHGFVSDFSWRTIPSLGGQRRDTKRYRVTGIYRKISDPASFRNVDAFLRILRELEAKDYQKPYQALRRENRREVTFDSWETHPGTKLGQKVVAGAYQIMWATWNSIIKKTGWPELFNPQMQDRVALYLLQESTSNEPDPKGIKRTALGYLMEGKVEEAVEKCSLYKVWACLPGGGKQQQITMPDVLKKHASYVKEA